MANRHSNRIGKGTARGIVTIELLIALAISVIMLTGATLVTFGGQTATLDTGLSNHGLYRALSTVDDRAMAVAAGTLFAAATTETDDPYTKVADSQGINACLTRVSGDVSWGSEKGRSLDVNFSTIIANVEEARRLGGGLCSIPPGGWDSPGTAGSADVSPNGIKGRGIDAGYHSNTRYAYVGTYHASVASSDFWVIDTSVMTAPVVVGSVHTGDGINDVDAVGDVVYAVAEENSEQLKVISVGTPTSPFVMTEVSLPNMSYTCTPASDPCLSGENIFYYDDRVYVGTNYLAFGTPPLENNEFHIFDVSTPATPIWLGSFDVNHNINEIVVSGDYAYLATSDNSGELHIYNISNPAAITLAATYNATGDEDGRSLSLVQNRLYLGRDSTPSGREDFYVLDVSTPTAPVVLGSKRIELQSGNEITGISVQGPYAFLATTDSNEEFHLWNVEDPTNIYQPCNLSIYNYPQTPNDLVYIDNLVFVTNRSNEILRIIYDTPDACPAS